MGRLTVFGGIAGLGEGRWSREIRSAWDNMKRQGTKRACRNGKRRAAVVAVALYVLPAGIGTAPAQTWLYNGTDYGTGSNWSTATTPGAGQTATFNAAGANQPVVNGSFTIGTVDMTAGSLTINPGSTLTVQGAYNLTNASILGGGTLAFAPAGPTAGLYMSAMSPVVVSSSITGNGEVLVGNFLDGPSGFDTDVTFTGNNSYSGKMEVYGFLRIGNGGTAGTLGTNDVTMMTGISRLVFNRSDAMTVPNQLLGAFGTVEQAGTGTTTLTANSPFLLSALLVSGGTLLVDGFIGNSVGATVNSGGTIGGIGTLPTTIVNAGGFLAPGNASIGTLSVNGNLTLAPGSTTRIRVMGGTSDRVNVAGTASLGGTLQVVPQNPNFNTTYTVVSAAGGRSGIFASQIATGSFGAGVKPTVSYDANNAYLTLSPNAIAPIVNNGTPNQQAVAAGLDRAAMSGANVSSYFSLYNLPISLIPQALVQIGGGVHTAVGTIGATSSGQFVSKLTDSKKGEARATVGSATESCRSDGRPEVTPCDMVEPLVAWIGALGMYRHVGGDIGRTEYSGGVAVGVDKGVAHGLRVGLAAAAGSASSTLDSGLSNLKASILQVGAYGQYEREMWLLNGGLSYSTMDVLSQRSIPLLGQQNVTSSYRTHGLAGRLEGTFYALGFDGFTLGPSAAFQGSVVWNPAFQETLNGAPAGVAVNAGSNVTTRGEFGARLGYLGLVAGLETSAYLRAAWAHYFNRESNMSASLFGLQGSTFSLSGDPVDMNSAVLSAGFDLKVTPRASIGLQFDTEFSQNEAQIFAGARVRFTF